jgi:hypothetical protein
MYTRKLYSQLTTLVVAIDNCVKTGNQEWEQRHVERACKIVEDHLPSGSGFDGGTHLDFERSNESRLIFTTAFHHMDEGGMYDGWTEHEIWVRPHLAFGITLTVKGRDRNQIKDYIGEVFDHALNLELDATSDVVLEAA